ncbi:CidB/LrgB family autolysis modulator [Paenibacillus oryzae]|uniref:CidB/LrgB family autolysis modulator n=1 Tax=Paenibacillus oryzae TaxID=1844972 RepID=A0A1A5YCX8_9BACL|nr:LrgB family protein [Paenibacillus oryzae]OBR63471.1 CidB/LrgB family autolysis modulator [Paenibacillus oryzae]
MIPFLCFCGTLTVYLASKWLHRRKPAIYTAPLLVAPIFLILVLLLLRVPYEDYNAGAGWLSAMIGPATVALAVPLYRHWEMLKRNAAIIVTSTAAGAAIAVISSALLAKIAHLSPAVTESLLPRSTTTPIAVAISGFIGGIPNLTAVFVLITGLLGMLLGPIVIKWFRIETEIARGVLFGTGAHAAGTAKAFEFGQISGTVSGIAMLLTAFITLCLAPWLITLALLG